MAPGLEDPTMNRELMIANVRVLINALVLTYWLKPMPTALEKAFNAGCRLLDEMAGGTRPGNKRICEVLESLCHNTKGGV